MVSLTLTGQATSWVPSASIWSTKDLKAGLNGSTASSSSMKIFFCESFLGPSLLLCTLHLGSRLGPVSSLSLFYSSSLSPSSLLVFCSLGAMEERGEDSLGYEMII